MPIKRDILQDVCNLVTGQVKDLYPDLALSFIPHEAGQFHEVVDASEHGLDRHPAAKIAQSILDKNNNRELSSFLGMAIHSEVKWLGLASKESMLALFNINTDEFDNAKDLRRAIYHLAWHAIDLVEIRQRPEYAAKFRSGPMIPKRSPMNLARLNLQADVFSAILCGLQGEDNALDVLAQNRAADSIMPVHARRAEDYPFVIALESAKYAYDQILALKPQRAKFLFYARQLATEVGKTFDDGSIRNWWGFSEPAQDMAWRNLPPEVILGSAVNTSEDPFVRATGHLVADITGIGPTATSKLGNIHNAYIKSEHNSLLHREMVEKAFEEAIARGVSEESGQPLIAAANAQNEFLAEGNILGWCAHALQAAARAFDSAILSGASPLQAARLEFEGTKDTTSWDMLKKVGDSIIEQKRKGLATTLGSIAEICHNNHPALAPILGSIRMTMKDPDFIKRLEAANDFAVRGPSAAPSASPAPKAPTPSAPAYSAPAFSAPGLGLGGGSSHHHAMMEQMRREKMLKDSGEKTDK
ncbi:MAG: hypothetical protein DI551_11315 [Micavibrio aeruginosavorus]|uniref:Uncharacterized protein n=1 Tax=Micavibrio aeruginosavorus TaxID=349221 RepID=A0A2W5MRM0_9BACT|nr:MAG: hypothetical protein DI551_11315 [Micavibrio aeruginosavorus]